MMKTTLFSRVLLSCALSVAAYRQDRHDWQSLARLHPGSTLATPGETILLFANGFGPVNPPVIKESVSQSGTLSPLPAVTIGGINATVSFAGLVAPGEFQFNVTVPSGLANGDQPIVAVYAGQTTQAGTTITIHI